MGFTNRGMFLEVIKNKYKKYKTQMVWDDCDCEIACGGIILNITQVGLPTIERDFRRLLIDNRQPTTAHINGLWVVATTIISRTPTVLRRADLLLYTD